MGNIYEKSWNSSQNIFTFLRFLLHLQAFASGFMPDACFQKTKTKF